MRLDRYMSVCLLHPEHGYYATRDPFGRAGDFITAPEISQMFGEMLGLCLAQAWLDQGRPAPFILAEAGPGRGTLMADMLRAMKAVRGMADLAAKMATMQQQMIEKSMNELTNGSQPEAAASTTTAPTPTLSDISV